MLFNSLTFAAFFVVVTTLYYLVPSKYRWMLLLLASCLFYMAFIPAYILILFLTIVIDYGAALYIERSEGSARRRMLLLSILATCLVLFVFKYLAFASTNIAALARVIGWNYSLPVLAVVLPIGLSFHTFQSLSYVIEVYRGAQRAERHLGIYSLYVMFYPQLVAGPIERPQNLLHQFREVKSFEYGRVTAGLRLMLWGLFKKVVIADRLAIYVNEVYGDPSQFGGPALVLATVAFAYQIYCDFSGYSDIAVGAARVMGFELMENFASPYSAASTREFWSRWHISLSTWFRDYVYIPLGGRRVSGLSFSRNIFITFVISGLWHGANWTYLAWGALNGLYIIVGHASAKSRASVREAVGIASVPGLERAIAVTTTFALTCVAWILFRADSMTDAWYIGTHLFAGWTAPLMPATTFSSFDLVVTAIAIATLESVQWCQRNPNRLLHLSEWPVVVRWPAYYALIAVTALFGVFEGTQFIYFQF